jgi:hypothetical protein
MTDLTEAIESADAEVQSCGGQTDDQLHLSKLLSQIGPRLTDLGAHLADAEPTVRAAAADLVGALGVAVFGEYVNLEEHQPLVESCVLGQAPVIRRMMAGDPDARARTAAVRAAIELRGVESDLTPLLIHCLDDAEPVIQDVAAAWLAERGHRAAVPIVLRRLASNPNTEPVRQTYQIGIPEAVPLLLGPVAGDDRWVAYLAAEALIEHVDERCVPALRIAVSRNLGDTTATPAAIALARHPFPAARDELLAGLDRHHQAHDTALRALAEIGAPDLTPLLIAHLGPRYDELFRKDLWPGERIATIALVRDSGAMRWVEEALSSESPIAFRMGPLLLAIHSQQQERDRERLVQVLRHCRDERQRKSAALAQCVLDLESVDALSDEVLRAPWTYRDDEWEGYAFVVAVGLQRLAERLRARMTGRQLSPDGTQRLRRVLAILEGYAPHIEVGIEAYRGRGNGSYTMGGYVFHVRDRLADARAGIEHALERQG